MYKLVTKAPLNIRSGPGMTFETVGNIKQGQLVESWEYKKDGGKIGWYRINEGWICANYVSLSTEAFSEIENSKKIRRVIQASDGEEEGETEKVPEDQQVGDPSATAGQGGGSLIPGMYDREEIIPVDAVLSKRAFGVPYQFMETVDARYGNTDPELGLDAKMLFSEAPMISLIPGKPYFLADLDDETKKSVIEEMTEFVKNNLQKPRAMLDSLSDSNEDMKYFEFEPDIQKFYSYVNTITALFAVYLGIGDEVVPGSGGKTFSIMDWSNYTLSNLFGGRPTTEKEMMLGISNLPDQAADKIQQAHGIMDTASKLFELTKYVSYFIDFFINPRVSYSESFNNSTKNSALEGMAQTGSDLGKELAFLVAAGANYTGNGNALEDLRGNVKKSIENYNGNPLIKRILGGASSIISGNNMVFPKIWAGSEYSRSYTIDIELKTPYGDKISIFMNILLPLSFLLAFSLPRQVTVNTYSAPFIVQGFLPGFCAIDMGIVSSLNISKGGDSGDAWTHDGLPLQMQVSLNIEDLYHNLMIAGIHNVGFYDAWNLLNNTGLLNYVAINSGVSLKKTPTEKMKEMLKALIENTPSRIMRSADIGLKQAVFRSAADFARSAIRLPGQILSNIR